MKTPREQAIADIAKVREFLRHHIDTGTLEFVDPYGSEREALELLDRASGYIEDVRELDRERFTRRLCLHFGMCAARLELLATQVEREPLPTGKRSDALATALEDAREYLGELDAWLEEGDELEEGGGS